jgi:hypothetical protein
MSNNPDPSIDTKLSPRDIEAQKEQSRLDAIATKVELKANKKQANKKQNLSASSRRGIINKKQRNESYNRTIKRVQSELPATDLLFSKIIHNVFIEKISDIVSNIIARPNAMLAGSVVAFILTLATYTLSKTIGYSLSGSETIIAFIVGWIIGIIYDYLRVLITGKKY